MTADAPPDANSQASSLQGRILIADDAPENRLLLEVSLRKTALEVTLVENGQEALTAALATPFDLVLLDMKMPVMDGYQTARALRGHGLTVPIVAFTASCMQEEIKECLEAGCNAHLPKPFGKQQLLTLLTNQLAERH